MPHDVFVSHSSHDKVLAEQLVTILEKHDIKCWAAMRDALYGPTYAKQIVEAIKSSKLVVLLFSVHSNDSPHIIREVEQAVDRRIPVVTMRVQDLMPGDDMAYFLKVGNWMDAFAGPFEPHAMKLAERVKLLLGQDAHKSAPAAPPSPASAAPAPPPSSAAKGPPPPAGAPGASAPRAHISIKDRDKETQIVASKPYGKIAAAVAVLIAVAVAVGVVVKGMFNSSTQEPDAQVVQTVAAANPALTADQVVAQMEFKPLKAGTISHPVTRREFDAFVAAQGRGYQTQAEKEANPFTWRTFADGDPVAYISWDEASAFCKWLSINAHKEVHLPSEAEWADAQSSGLQPGNLWQWCSDGVVSADPPAPGAPALKLAERKTAERMAWPGDHGLSTLGFRVIAAN